MVRGPGAIFSLDTRSRFLPGENGRLLEFFSQWGGKKQHRQAKNTRKGDSKQIVTQITGQRHTEVRVANGFRLGKMVLVLGFFSALIFFCNPLILQGGIPGGTEISDGFHIDFLVSASCGLYIHLLICIFSDHKYPQKWTSH